jgi:pSer/pThr/pTyr-binding forkhead associated (FHA) protein
MITHFPFVPQPSCPALIVTHGNTANKHRPLRGDTMVLGRARGCDLRLESPEVSDVHCVVVRGRDGIRIRDCNSRTGTRLNGQSVREALLRDGDTLQIGLFSFQVSLPNESSPTRLPTESVSAGSERVSRLERSRRRLVQRALAVRRRIRDERNAWTIAAERGLAERQAEMDRSAELLREQFSAGEQRACRLEEGERALAKERAALDQELAALEDARRQLAEERSLLEQEVRHQSEESHRRAEEAERKLDEHLRQCATRKPVGEAAEVPGKSLLEAALVDEQLAELQAKERARYLLEARVSLGEAGPGAARSPEGTGPETEAFAEEPSARQAVVAVLAGRALLERELQVVRDENEQLRALVAEHEDAPTVQGPWFLEADDLRRKIASLTDQLQVKAAQLAEFAEQKKEAERVVRVETMGDIEKYEAELNAFRHQLEADRAEHDEEMRRLQERKAELNETVRSEELQLARERAQLARERVQVDQMRELLRIDLERAEREGQVRRRLAGLQRSRT